MNDIVMTQRVLSFHPLDGAHQLGSSDPAVPFSADEYEQLVRDGLLQDPEALATHRVNATGTAKDIHASIDSHTDHGAEPPQVNYTATVDDVYSQHAEGDCLPEWLQEQRAVLKNLASHGDEGAQEALGRLDETIVRCAVDQQAQGIRPRTFEQTQTAVSSQISKLQDQLDLERAAEARGEEIQKETGRPDLDIHALVHRGEERPLTAGERAQAGQLIEQISVETDPLKITVIQAQLDVVLNRKLLTPEQTEHVQQLLGELSTAEDPNQAVILKAQLDYALNEASLTPPQKKQARALIENMVNLIPEPGSEGQLIVQQTALDLVLHGDSLTPAQQSKAEVWVKDMLGLLPEDGAPQAATLRQLHVSQLAIEGMLAANTMTDDENNQLRQLAGGVIGLLPEEGIPADAESSAAIEARLAQIRALLNTAKL